MIYKKERYEIEDLVKRLIEDMKSVNDADLNRLLLNGFSFEMISGRKLPKSEFVRTLRSGQMKFHNMRQEYIRVEEHGDTADVTVKVNCDAEMFGAKRGPLRMLMKIHLERYMDTFRIGEIETANY